MEQVSSQPFTRCSFTNPNLRSECTCSPSIPSSHSHSHSSTQHANRAQPACISSHFFGLVTGQNFALQRSRNETSDGLKETGDDLEEKLATI